MAAVTSRVCFKCNRTLSVTEFYAHPQMSDGHLGKCKECTRRDVAGNRESKIDAVRQYDRTRARRPNRKMMSVDKNARKRASVGPAFDHAHRAVARALAAGVIVKPAICDRCPSTDRIQAHHDDYNQPLVVMWLCPVCHANRHKELGRLRTIRAAYGPDPELGF